MINDDYILRPDHVMVLVKDLERAVSNYRQLGFQVLPGGELKGGARNAIIPFQDGTYLELFSIGRALPLLAKAFKAAGLMSVMTKGQGSMEKRFIPNLARGDGLLDFAIHTSGLEQQLHASRARGLEIEGPIEGSRKQPDGTSLHFRWGLSYPYLPFLIEDITPRNLRVPSTEEISHPNGSVGMKEIEVGVPEVQDAAIHFSRLLGSEGHKVSDSRYEFGVHRTKLILFGPNESEDVKQHIWKKGAGLISLQLYTTNPSFEGQLDPIRSCKARISLICKKSG